MADAKLSAVTATSIEAIESARARIAGIAVRTPLLELQGTAGPKIFLKLENLQPINSFKLRGAANAVAMLDSQQRKLGVWVGSSRVDLQACKLEYSIVSPK